LIFSFTTKGGKGYEGNFTKFSLGNNLLKYQQIFGLLCSLYYMFNGYHDSLINGNHFSDDSPETELTLFKDPTNDPLAQLVIDAFYHKKTPQQLLQELRLWAANLLI
jgi:hypothetical protein